jgi:hypothetical protein
MSLSRNSGSLVLMSSLTMMRYGGRRIVGRKRNVDVLLRGNGELCQNKCEKERSQSQSRLHLLDGIKEVRRAGG